MTTATHARGKLRVLPFVIALVFVAFACGEMRPDEIECEEAIEHLRKCCPGVDPRGYNCVYQESCGETLRPSLTIQTSQCVRRESCDTLVQTGACARAVAGNYLPDDQRGVSYDGVRSDFDKELCR